MVRAGSLIVALALAAGCATAPVPALVENPRAVWCALNEPARPSPAVSAAMTLSEKQEAVAHNRKGELWCGWSP